ncbi:Uncharacterized protein OBRU01_11981 [Operophtera brumata]|uniref:Uncharacterized protein n=1 Tax=Operophtera brumata TaxID=104452 RepID=A0A0L7LBE0_OPEBR|nr:Uncharacterized protein OBRU01_11981 [Operophtera brumata]
MINPNLSTSMNEGEAEDMSNIRLDRPTIDVTTTTASRVTTTPMDVVQCSPTTREETNDSPWQTQHHSRRSTKPLKILTGSGKADDTLQTVEEMKFIQVWSLKPDTTEENIRNYLGKIRVCDSYVVKKRVIKTDSYAAFEIGLPQSLYDVLRGENYSARPASAATRLRSAVRATSTPAMDDQQPITVCPQNIASIDNKTGCFVTK